jgi:hypothetical protein
MLEHSTKLCVLEYGHGRMLTPLLSLPRKENHSMDNGFGERGGSSSVRRSN